LSGLGQQLRWRVVALAAVIAAVLGGGAWFALSGASAQEHRSPGKDATAQAKTAHTHKAVVTPITVASFTPASHTHGVNGADSIRVVFSAPLAADSPMPSLSPSIAGSWQRVSPDTVEFVPAQGFPELTRVRVVVPAGSAGVRSAAGGLLATQAVDKFWTGSFSTTRVEQVLAQLGYLPLAWSPAAGGLPVPTTDANAQLSAAYDPPPGSFSWQPGYPSELMNMWSAGQTNEVLTGAVMAFESDQGLAMDGVAGPEVWHALLQAVAKGQDNTHGYTYALASQVQPETLTVWHDGRVLLHTLANTGIPAAPTTVGTAAVYLKYSFQIMKGTNPDGTKYADPVSWVSYFRSGEAVHYFARGSYGYQQSLGCVELPYAQAKFIWPYLTYGTLVTVTPA
jgi:peptidoglycan hydrolase-like protein with peptidoglycan-binding domain